MQQFFFLVYKFQLLNEENYNLQQKNFLGKVKT